MAISTTQKGIFARDLKSLSNKDLMEQLNTLKGSVKIAGYRSKVPAKKDPANYGSNKNLLNNCQELPIDKALDALEQELKLIMTHNPWVFSMLTLKHYVDGYTEDYEEFSQTILKSLIKCIETLLERMTTEEINYENLHRICSFIYVITMVIENYPNHITQDCIIVEQAYIGESDNELLGTIRTIECVCVAIQDVKTGKVYFAHIDSYVTKESIEETIAFSFPNSTNLIARLFGGRDKNEITMNNTKKIIDALPSNVKIISSDIANIELEDFKFSYPFLSTTFIINPKTFEVTNSCPVHLTNNVISSIIQFNYRYGKVDPITSHYTLYPLSCDSKLHMLYTNGQHTPLLITDIYTYYYATLDYRASLNTKLNNMKKEKDTLNKLKHCAPYNILRSLEIKEVIDSLIQKAQDTAKEKSIPLSNASINRIMINLTSINLYIGPNASEANKPIFDFIENHLFKDDDTLDLDGLSEIQMDHDSHCYLQPAKDISNPTSDESMGSPVKDMELSANFH